jgi:hypothetical protein
LKKPRFTKDLIALSAEDRICLKFLTQMMLFAFFKAQNSYHSSLFLKEIFLQKAIIYGT